MGRRRWWRGGAVAVLAAALAASVVASTGPGAVAQPMAADDRGEPVSVTLVSGDRVQLWGSDPAAPLRIEPAPRAHSVPFQDYWHDGDRYVVPGDAALLVGAGVLDRELFNVTGLIRQRYDDAHTAAVPLLVEYADAGARARAAVPAGATVRRALPEFNLTALDQDKDSAQNLYGALTRPTARSATGVRKVWLNKRVRATLDQSVPQVGAPTAWERGLTGAGVRVAVLDTGIDTDHPDLAGKTVVSKDFTGTGGVEDGHGHGTHIASIVTGTGAASGGKYRGVAPGVSLAVGKVLDDSGWGTDDGVLAGMRWAAAESGAKVVNMSLGSDPTDGQDPMSLAVNALSREYGTLFVIAAGNYGADRTVGSPAAADDALTVGSVSKQDEPSDFSSRGPRRGDGAAKPEISAPGGSIVAARPAGVPPLGEPVGDGYQRLDGTSMATPHVAGAAAILAQQHPDWTAPMLKSALVSSAHDVSAGVFEVGAGRLDVAGATATPVVATAAVSAYLPWPNAGTVERRTVTWTNTGGAPVTLALSAELVDEKGAAAPAGLVALTQDSVTVPAGGSAPVEVVVTGQEGRTGTYSGVLVASAGDVRTRTAISVYQQEQRFSFTPTLLDRTGAEPVDEFSSSAFVIDLESGDINSAASGQTITLPRGRYAVHAAVTTSAPGQESSYTTISHPELNLDRDVTQVFDARIGQPVIAEPDNPEARGGTHAMYAMSQVAECDCRFAFVTDADARFQPLYAATLPGTASDAYALGVARRATEPGLEMVADDGQEFDVNLQALFSLPPAEETTLTAVYGGSGTPEDLAGIDATGKLVVVEFDPYVGREEWLRRGVNIAKAGGKLAMFRFIDEGATPLPPGDPIEGEPVPTFYGDGSGTVDRLTDLVKEGETTVEYASRETTDLRYELIHGVERQVTAPVVYRPRTADLATMRAAYHDNAPNSAGFVAFGKLFGRYVGTGWFARTAGGRERVEYFTPTEWELSATTGPYVADETVTLEANRPPARIAWNKAVVGPSLRGTTKNFVPEDPHPWSWRNDGRINVKLPMYGDAAGRPRMVDTFSDASGSVTVYRDDVALGTVPVTDFSEYPVPDADSSYRVVADARQHNATWTLSTVVTAEWSFRSSAAGEGKALPMLTTRFDPAVDVRNQAPGNRRFSFPAYVERQDGPAKITSLKVDVSYDDGKTWRPADVRRDGRRWAVSVRHPANGHVSLRSTASDSDGNRLTQTVLRAYQLG
ncbi:S8 family peptidase [Actinophytocola algeriensis]|uniref:Subtilisin family serine protease n=1 Tax=Actinophytocola algeriensis TaxID=1768010 RepID=A0A7W7VJ16_9PSEU|nr:S8 family peptidase [Actinophytocola algeriensis]MBB4911610.1 subtilisin family serine protease [Actinophytocola algeriensis]MBE1473402.1 subtilisin family serine protease [Actinophytocola algeriensis]